MEKAGGAYWWILVMSQVFHVWMCKTRFSSIFSHGIFNNMMMWYGVIIELLLIFIFLFVPKLNAVLVGLPFTGKFFPLFLVPWATLFVVNEGRKWIGRKYPGGFVAKWINW